MNNKPLLLVNSTGLDLRFAEAEIRASIANVGALPEELADVLCLHFIEDEHQVRAVLTPA